MSGHHLEGTLRFYYSLPYTPANAGVWYNNRPGNDSSGVRYYPYSPLFTDFPQNGAGKVYGSSGSYGCTLYYAAWGTSGGR